MKKFDPITDIKNCQAILDNGAWPNFHDAIVYSLNFWRGDLRPENDVWVLPTIDPSLELDAVEFPYVVDLRFHDCRDVHLASFDHNNDIYWLSFSFEHRGYCTDGVTPLAERVKPLETVFLGNLCSDGVVLAGAQGEERLRGNDLIFERFGS